MSVAGLIAVILIAFVIGALFYFVFRNRGPWGSFWTFFLVLFLGVYLAHIWVRPIGPVYWGVAFLPLLFVGLLIALLLAAAAPSRRKNKDTSRNHPPAGPAAVRDEVPFRDDQVMLGIFFWTALFLLIALLVAGIYF
ncbi:hypothetical protein [Botryobacter ruber]|uniref:hypothetical protein n=1 Tax=Botryobacter ruber TaxID=2171629 RepID=UPI000FEC2831|nr:hypothetical protein [Botryobacter ruber]